MTIVYLILTAVFVIVLLFAIDRHLCLKDVEKDLKIYLGDLLVARELVEGNVRVHYQATVASIKTLIRTHFKL